MNLRSVFIQALVAGAVVVATQVAHAQQNPTASSGSALVRAPESFNPDMSVIVDMYYHTDDSEEGISHTMEEISGFGHVHSDGEHHHHGVENGLNMRHLELQLSANVDPYFKGSAIAAVSEEGAELETAEMETTSLPGGFKLRGGKFYSDFGYINAQHSHQWDFTDQPLVFKLCLGDHGLNDKGVQVSWLAPTPFYLLAGIEAFQGENETMFAYGGEEPLPSYDGPRTGVAWLKCSPDLPGNHALQVGISGASGQHQEAHDGNGDGLEDHWLDGVNTFWCGDFIYKYSAPQAYGADDFVVQGEYFCRHRDLEVVGHDLMPQLVGTSRLDDQDGYYVQAVYGFLPRWRGGIRWEEVGLMNDSELPDGTNEKGRISHRTGAMLDFTPSEFSRLRLQVNRGSYATVEGKEDVTEAYLQWMVSIGAHAAHKF